MTSDLPGPPQLGETLGHYELLSVLGRGGMGVVYLAEDRRLRRRVALKMLPPETARDPERLKRFRREAKTVASLSHPNVVTLYSVEEQDGRTFLTMELVEGRTLAEEIPIGGLPLRRALEIGTALADALAAAHQRGILHRDLKPSNVMITPTGWVKVLDFGLAKLRPEDDLTVVEGRGTSLLQTQEGKILGTPSYMSPEQLRGHSIDERSDLFSFGLILHEMLTGAMPFAGQTSAERIAAVLRDPPAPLVSLRPDAPIALVQLVERCLGKLASERPATAGEVRDRLAALRRELEISELMTSSGLVKAVPARSAPAPWRIAAGLAAAAAMVVMVFWLAPRERHSSTAAPALAADERERPSVAVLPLGNYSGEPEYFVDGMTDGLIGSLARLGNLRVISRQSSMHYKGSSQRLGEIAAELGVDFVVEGSVARQGDRVTLQAHVVQPDPEEQLWAASFERAASDVLALHNEVASRIAVAVHAPPSSQEEARMAATGRVDPAAYEAYLQGRYWAGKFDSDDLLHAKGYFERAIALDSSFAPAWTGLAETLGWLARYHMDTRRTMGEAETAAQRALQLDPNESGAHAVLSGVEQSRWNWEAAERHSARAIELDPSSAGAHRSYWRLLAPQGRLEEAHREIQAARQLDPLSAQIASNLGIQLVFERRYEEAEAVLVEALEIDPDFTLVHGWLWMLYAKQEKDPQRGLELVEYLAAMDLSDPLPELRRRIASEGYERALRWVALELSRTHAGDEAQVGVVGGLLAEAGETEEALRWLRFGLERRVWELPWLSVTPDYDRLRDLPEYRRILEALGLPPTG